MPTNSLTERGFTDHEHLEGVELIHMNGRIYDYNLGRFLSVDPFVVSPTDSQSWNPYTYIRNNPLSGTDPTGYQGATDQKEVTDQLKAEKAETTSKEVTVKVSRPGSRIKTKVTVTVTSNGNSVSSVSISGGTKSARGTVANALGGGGADSGSGVKGEDSGGNVEGKDVGGAGKRFLSEKGFNFFMDEEFDGKPPVIEQPEVTEAELEATVELLKNYSEFVANVSRAEKKRGRKLKFELGDESSHLDGVVTIGRDLRTSSYVTDDINYGDDVWGEDAMFAFERSLDVSTAPGVQVPFSVVRAVFHEVLHSALPFSASDSDVIRKTNKFMKDNFNELNRRDHTFDIRNKVPEK